MATQNPAVGTAVGRCTHGTRGGIRRVTETKAFYKTSEFMVLIAAVIGVAIALNKNPVNRPGFDGDRVIV